MTDWQSWTGRTEQRRDHIDSAAFGRWLATLDRAAPDDGSVPQAYHWCLCLPDAPTAQLGPDGHPLRDDSADSFMPPIPLPRRMWASSKVEFLQPLRVGDPVVRTSKIVSVTEKTGGSGQLVFVDVAHETAGPDGVAVRETQSLVYRAAADADAPLAPPEVGVPAFTAADWTAHRALVPAEPLLFRYSALTFNSHRIHYDAPYARDVERYRGLVVHGPLTATLLLDLAQRELGDNRLTGFAFRGTSPAICGETLHLVMRNADDGLELAAFADDGRQIVAATASVR
jgi:3-methylfumaryl-CoA hydratase